MSSGDRGRSGWGRRVLTCAVLALALGGGLARLAVSGQERWAPDRPEPGSVEAIARFTTEPRFGNPWVAYVPDSATVPSPTRFLGHVVGAPGELSRTDRIYGYFRALAKASPRVRVETIGTSDEGRDILLVIVSDERAIADLPRLKAAAAALADPRTTTPEAAERLIATARPFYYLNAGLHSDETGSPEMVMELAYRLAVSEQPMIKAIRESVVVLINPVAEPDGRDRFVDWFYRHLKGKTDYESLPPVSPPYYGRYVFHDNNRDSHQRALETTRAVHRMFHEYHPVAVHDLHESIALLQTWNGTGPWNPNLDPIVVAEVFDMAFAEVRQATALGMPGVWTWAFGEGFGHHYTESVATNHNAIGRGYETFGNGSAETMERTLRNEKYLGLRVTEEQWYRPAPPPRTFTWSLRDNTNYMETGCLAILDYTAGHAKEMLRAFYRKGYNSWQKGLAGKPYAFVIPAGQPDRRRVAEMVNLLRAQRIEVSRAAADVTVKEGTFPKGSYVVRLDQPYRNYAVDLLAPQKFPADAQFQPYDDISWALPVHYGVQALRVDDERIVQAALEPLTADVAPEGTVSGEGDVYLLRDTGQEALLAARARLAAFQVEIAEREFTLGGATYPAGSWLIPAQPSLRPALVEVAKELALDFTAATAPSGTEAGATANVPRHAAPVPRLAIWHAWADTQAAGWIRRTLDIQKVPYEYIRDDDIRAGGLKGRWDVIVWPETSSDLQEQIHGIDRRFSPLAYTRTPEFPTHGLPDASDDITGGIGWAGLASLQRFLNEGGVLITLGNGSALALDGGLVRGVSHAPGESGVWTPGVELRVSFARPGHPIAYGYHTSDSVFRASFPVYRVRPPDKRWVVLQWGSRPPKEDREDEDQAATAAGTKDEPMVVSGGAKGEDALEGRPAILDVPVGRGRVIAYNFNPLHRDLNRSDYRLLWNAVLNWSALGR
ncbi:MAG: peptidase [Acidobacteria bacterium]|nr:peptidase [Acidobacteriota bacterium]